MSSLVYTYNMTNEQNWTAVSTNAFNDATRNELYDLATEQVTSLGEEGEYLDFEAIDFAFETSVDAACKILIDESIIDPECLDCLPSVSLSFIALVDYCNRNNIGEMMDNETYGVCWDNGHATGEFTEKHRTLALAAEAGEDWRRSMISEDDDPEAAEEAYTFTVFVRD